MRHYRSFKGLNFSCFLIFSNLWIRKISRRRNLRKFKSPTKLRKWMRGKFIWKTRYPEISFRFLRFLVWPKWKIHKYKSTFFELRKIYSTICSTMHVTIFSLRKFQKICSSFGGNFFLQIMAISRFVENFYKFHATLCSNLNDLRNY